VLLPLAGAILLPAAARASERARDALAVALAALALGAAGALLPAVLAGETPSVAVAGVELLRADRLAVLMAVVSLSLGTAIAVYATGYLAGQAHRTEYHLVVSLFLGAMMALVFARNLLVLYAAWEVTAFACWRLIAFFRGREQVVRADKAFLVTAAGAVLMLLGFVALGSEAGTFDLVALRGTAVPPLATGLVLAGLLSKSATLPLHSWLPDAGVAPSPVTALLHAAVLVKIGVYVYARLFGATLIPDPGWAAAVPWIAAASALVAGAAALLEHDLKRIIAYSTVAQLGFVFLGLSAGGATAAGGALLLVAVHAVAKGGLFLCAGVVEHAAHTKDVRRLGGLARHLPVTAAAFALCALSVMGLPPFGGFFAKHVVLAAAFERSAALGLAFTAASALTVLYLLRAFALVFLGAEGEAVRGRAVHEGTPVMVGTVALLGAGALAAGLGVAGLAALAEAAARDLWLLPGPPAPGLGLHLGPEWAWSVGLAPLALLVARAGAAARGAALRFLGAAAIADLLLFAGLSMLEAGRLGGAPRAGSTQAALVLAALGACGRLAVPPFQGWLGDVAEAAPGWVTALAATLGKLAGAAVLARLLLEWGPPSGAARGTLLGLGALAAAGGLALLARPADPRRRAAHLSVAHGGLVLALFSAGLRSAAIAAAVVGAAVAATAFLLADRRAPGVTLSPLGGERAGVRGGSRLERLLDPGPLASALLSAAAAVLFALERALDAVLDRGARVAARGLATLTSRAHDGSHATYLVWSVAGLAGLLLFLLHAAGG
jgi:NADH:ubiquinone oxidoreductase subunit 5 (subunit L)/multisubunit Na+/H+ antiporter MnhA subunit